uniref:DUF885 domain-containing protein n=1 Tax=uncultured Phenylobacterium sp. TaxID=349273 RepID=UPI0025DB9D36
MKASRPHPSRRGVVLTGIAMGLYAGGPTKAGAQAKPATDPRLAALLDDFVAEILAASPLTATGLGMDGGARAPLKGRLDDVSAAGRAGEVAAYAGRATRLRAIPRASLSSRDLTTYDIVLYSQEVGAEGGRFAYGKDFAVPYVVSQQDGTVANTGEFLNAQHMIETRADCDAYLARLEQYATALDQENARMADAAARGVVPPDFLLTTALGTITELRGTKAGETGLVTSLSGRAKAKGLGDYAARAVAIVTDKIHPALDRQIAAVQALQAKATHDAGVWKFPDGADYFRWSLKYNTTTDLTAAEIHKTGLDQGAEIDAQMDKILRAQGFTQGSVGERMGALTRDPRFLFPDTEAGRREVIAYIEGSIAAIRPHMGKLSRLGLKAPVQVRPVPKEIEAGAGLGYMNYAALDGSRPAIYYVNLSDIANWPKYTLASLSMHEALPGHAWQGAYLAERPGEVHTISSLMVFSAFIEGWGVYSEQLADEIGLYRDDPMSR